MFQQAVIKIATKNFSVSKNLDSTVRKRRIDGNFFVRRRQRLLNRRVSLMRRRKLSCLTKKLPVAPAFPPLDTG